MGWIRRRRVRQVLVPALWLLVVLVCIAWRHPEFWVSTYSRYLDAQDLIRKGEFQRALQKLDLALRDDPDQTGYINTRGYLLLEMRNDSAARATFERGLRLDPKNPEALLGLAQAQLNQNQISQLKSTLDRMESLPLDFEQKHRRAQLYGQAGESRTALVHTRAIMEEAPRDRGLIWEAVRLAAAQQDWQEVITLANRLMGMNPPDEVRIRANELLSMAYEITGQPSEALKTINEKPSPENLRNRIALNLQLGYYGQAVTLLEELLEVAPSDGNARKDLAWAQQQTGDEAGAEATYRSLMESGQADPETRVRYAWLLNSQKRHREAWDVIAVLPRPSKDPALLELQAMTAFWAGKMEEAAHLLQKLLETGGATALGRHEALNRIR